MRSIEPPSEVRESASDRSTNWRQFAPLDLPPILQVTLEQMVAHGYEGTTVRSIAKAVGVTVPALYYHYENKQALLVALLDRAMTIVTRHVDEALAEAGDKPSDRLVAAVQAISLYSGVHRDLAALDGERRSLTPRNHLHYVERRDRIDVLLREIVETGCRNGDFKTTTPVETSRAILSMCQGISTWFDPAGPLSPAAVAERYARIALAAAEFRRS